MIDTQGHVILKLETFIPECNIATTIIVDISEVKMTYLKYIYDILVAGRRYKCLLCKNGTYPF